MSIKVGYIDIHLPDEAIPIDSFLKSMNFENSYDPYNISNNKFISSIYKIDSNMEEHIFEQLVKKYLLYKRLDGSEIDYLIYTQSDSNENKLSVAYSIQYKLNLSNAQVFSINQGCSGTLIAMKVASALINNRAARRVLILTSCFTQKDSERFIGSTILSDGIGLMEVTGSDGVFQMLDFMGKTNGGINEDNFHLNGNPARIVNIGAKLIKAILKKNSMTLDNIACIVPLNTSKEAWSLYCDALKCTLDKVFLDNIIDGGHMGAVDTIRNLKSIIDKNNLKEGEYIILFGMGFGTSWDVMLLQSV
ncbi:3-oxoacyl-[acyl-carrier-protein] synthase III [Anaerobacterium chartisolvens]|uniref:3-oxoacyl-[acyl-carrier-protein] synthase III n=1 Tax=Anaerobacterium chartisolvens TaxID=1297424 RepID=A0A369B701_9FIRM|nr:3-oxoacyl-[acyl-carrier-protein] synthase III C-terminal domain-containing protein [Anaerobacterium chartisolvens]RCX16326.1 3-oxoacyl-[acyl-carrier-protein] synthase III [Anaerobacterium chartisolvens]